MDTLPADSGRRRFVQGMAALGGSLLAGSGVAATARLPLAEYEQMDATALAEHIRHGRLTPVELLDAVIARIEARSALNAVVLRHFDMAREAAVKMSGLGKAARERLPVLHGVPFALKDLGIGLQGTVTTNGSRFFQDAVASQDSTLVTRYKAAGLNICAKTASPEFGQTSTTESSLWGVTPNPWDRRYSAGGSSGGSGAAVAAGLFPVVHATDGGGSIRIPAAHCGVFGLKPSRGLLPAGPQVMEATFGLSTAGVISRSVRDTVLLLELTQGREPGGRVGPPRIDLLAALRRPEKGLRIALMTDSPFGNPVHVDCLQAVERAARQCEALGHRVEKAVPRLPIREMFSSLGFAMGSAMLASFRSREAVLGRAVTEADVEPLNWRTLRLASAYTAEQLYQARIIFDQASRAIDAFFADYDLLLSPVTAGPPPLVGELSLDQPYERFVQAAIKSSGFTSIHNICGTPAMSVPLHWNADGLPIGVQFAAPFGGEGRLLGLAAQLEQAMPWKKQYPPL